VKNRRTTSGFAPLRVVARSKEVQLRSATARQNQSFYPQQRKAAVTLCASVGYCYLQARGNCK